MPQCSGIKRDGGRCTVIVNESLEYCYQHDPARTEDRRRAASKAGKSKPSRELVDIKQRLSSLARDVLEGAVDKGTGAVVSQILNVYLRAIATELRLKEQEEIIARLELVEEKIETKRRNQPWGA
jgi:hypothetical protein